MPRSSEAFFLREANCKVFTQPGPLAFHCRPTSGAYQMMTRSFGARYILSPGLTLNAS